jgi:predicted TIM-barrel enzyme
MSGEESMAGSFVRANIVACLQEEREAGRAIYDALCGSGITAKMAARGGADLVTTHCLAYFRMQGLSPMLAVCSTSYAISAVPLESRSSIP